MENIAGGAGQIAAPAATRAAADGYTYFLAGLNHITIDRLMFKLLPCDADRDFAIVGQYFTRIAAVDIVYVPNKGPAQMLQDAAHAPSVEFIAA